MGIDRRLASCGALLTSLIFIIIAGSGRLGADTGSCGGVTTTLPFTDVMGNTFFCQIAEAFFSGLSNGTTPTTYSPGLNVPREQMAAFVSRTLDQSLKRRSRRAALKQFWAPRSENGLGLTTVAHIPEMVVSDGADLWVPSLIGTVSRVRASDGKKLESWTGAQNGIGVLSAKGLIFVTGCTSPGIIYQIDPTQPAGVVTTLTSSLPPCPQGISFDGARIWTTNKGTNSVGSVSIVTLNPVSVTTVSSGFSIPYGILYDGASIWVSDPAPYPGKLLKLDSNGGIIQTTELGGNPGQPVFDGTNIWVPNQNTDTMSVVRASTGALLATLTGNGMQNPFTAAFDGERVLVTNLYGDTASIWKASDLTPLGSVSLGTGTLFPFGACSDGLNFWISLQNTDRLARF